LPQMKTNLSGVSHLQDLPSPTPAINQIELHPWCQQRPIVDYCKAHGIAVQAYSPLLRGDQERFNDPTLVKVCEKHGKEQAQVLIRWSLQKG
jgi:diketogulonate reductase-like aldo/keto reductase